jgi:alkanesulfonate monooxygenase SsuD/methylene tetrahydromethanopterin reductase-like flavin-dependent oxidoreductase (luciferase family)
MPNDSAIPPLLASTQPLLLGLFIPALDGGWSLSSAPRETNFSFEYNRRCVLAAEAMGLDFTFQVGQWRAGFGGRIRYRERVLEAITTSAALAAITERITLISTVHVLYGVHPMVIAKQGANIDHISGGRWGINVVAGWAPDDIKIFGLPVEETASRYERTSEFVEFLERAWRTAEPFSFDGRFYRAEGAIVCPLPRSPLVVNAAMSPQGRDFATSHAHAMFITNPRDAGPNPRSYPELSQLIASVKQQARAKGRELRCIVNAHVIQRARSEEAWCQYRAIVDAVDEEALANFVGHISKNASVPRWTREHDIVGGNVILVGDAAEVASSIALLRAAGCDGVQLTFFDYLVDLERFRTEVLPLLVAAGLRR